MSHRIRWLLTHFHTIYLWIVPPKKHYHGCLSDSESRTQARKKLGEAGGGATITAKYGNPTITFNRTF